MKGGITASILVDVGTKAVITVGSFVPAIVFLNKSTSDTFHIPAANFPHYTSSFFLTSLPPAEYPMYTWTKQRKFINTPTHVITEELKSRSRLATAKRDAITKLMHFISRMRSDFSRGVDYQEIVYVHKRQQAERYISDGCDESGVSEFPYLIQYADLAGLSLKEAAEEIILKSKMDDELLARTEAMRLKYFQLLKSAQTTAEIDNVLKKFFGDYWRMFQLVH